MNPPLLRHRTRCVRERGAALLVALVLVLVSTLIGISVMEDSGIETRLVANEAMRQSLFHAAESASEEALLDADATTLSGTAAIAAGTQSIDTRVTVAADVRLEGVAPLVGSSLGLFQNILYRASASASIGPAGAAEASRAVVQGAARRAPATLSR